MKFACLFNLGQETGTALILDCLNTITSLSISKNNTSAALMALASEEGVEKASFSICSCFTYATSGDFKKTFLLGTSKSYIICHFAAGLVSADRHAGTTVRAAIFSCYSDLFRLVMLRCRQSE